MDDQSLTTLLSKREKDFLALARSLAVCKIVSGFFHEMSQPLCGIRGFSELAQLQSENHPQLHKYVTMIREQSDRLNELLNEFHGLFDDSKTADEKSDLLMVLEEIMRWANQQVKSRSIDLEKELASGPLNVNLSRANLRALLLLLYAIVRDRVSQNPEGRAKKIAVKVKPEVSQVTLELIDTGLEQYPASELECALCSLILNGVRGSFSAQYTAAGAVLKVQMPLVRT